jgi:hypothetical protein
MNPQERRKTEIKIDKAIQLRNLRELSDKIWKTSRRFDLDIGVKDSKWDRLVD